MNSEQILRRIGEIGIVPVIRANSVEESLLAVQAIYAGGIPIVEITMTVPDAIHVIKSVVERYGDEVLIGAGTVTTANDARKCIDAGAQFLVSPGLSPPVLKAAAQQRILALPGAFTPTEVMNALAEGARVIKIFPCSSGGGPQHLKALHGPFPDVALIPTGGVNASNAAQYIMAGAFALGAGGELIDSNSLKNGDLSETTSAAKRLTAAVAAARAVKHNPELSKKVPQPAL
jgi:2-dehydro-3-deoxyphosphogluconate aldolase / (4S)-4-hydroxy-2-oxoglutarate aldolase